MRRLHLLVEGQTEEILCQQLFIPHLEGRGWGRVTHSVLTTRRLASGAKFRGGVSGWEKIRREIGILLPSFDLVTTMIDYYGLPAAVPGMADRPTGPPDERVRHVERAMAAAIDDARFLPHLTLHETESWVFAAADVLADLLDDQAVAGELRQIAEIAGGPEGINDSPESAPSKRLLRLVPGFIKTLHGPLSVADLGIVDLRKACPHLDGWLTEVERLVG